MKTFGRALAIGSLSMSALVATPALAMAGTTSNDQSWSCGIITISEKTIGQHIYITITTPFGSITVDPPKVMP